MPPSAPHRKCSRGGATTCYVYTASNIGARRAWNLPRKALRARKWREGRSRAFHQVGKKIQFQKKKWKKKTSASAGPHLPCCVLTVRLCASSPWHDLPRFFPPRRMSPTTADVSTHILNICRSCYDLGQSVHGCADQSSRQTFMAHACIYVTVSRALCTAPLHLAVCPPHKNPNGTD